MDSLNALKSRNLESNPPSVLGVVGVVVIHYQHPAITQQCLDALAQQQGVRIALRLVDNSKDGDAPAFNPSDNFHSFHRLRGENHGFSHANNLGLADLRRDLARADFLGVLLLNNDAFMDPDSLYRLAQTLRSESPLDRADQAVSVVAGATLLHPNRSLQSAGTRWHLRRGYGLPLNQATTPQSVLYTAGESLEVLDYPSGAALMLNPMALQALDWSMDPTYFLYFEELDMLCRLHEHGPVLVFPSTSAMCVHLEGASAGSGHHHHDRSTFSDYHFHRSKKHFYRKHFPSLLPRMGLLHLGVLSKRLLRMQWAKANAVWKGYFWS